MSAVEPVATDLSVFEPPEGFGSDEVNRSYSAAITNV